MYFLIIYVILQFYKITLGYADSKDCKFKKYIKIFLKNIEKKVIEGSEYKMQQVAWSTNILIFKNIKN